MDSLYFHIPFCRRRCLYCDFITFANMEHYVPVYFESLKKEIRVVINPLNNLHIHSIYFGGGTPSIIPAAYYVEILHNLRDLSDWTNDCEISLEANPGTLSLQYLEQLSEAGINRLSIGVQSTDTFDLERLGRIHSIDDVLENYYNARKVGFDNINLDMIFALPWQDFKGWKNSLDRAVSLHPEHFSLYSLIVEPGTPLYTWHQKGWIEPQDEDLEADMYEYAMEALDSAGYKQYEISNWSRVDAGKSKECRHNRQYWLNAPYFGFGAGAHGYVDGIRTMNALSIPEYIRRMQEPLPTTTKYPCSQAAVSSEVVDKQTQMRDFMMLGLRLVKEGVSAETFETRYDRSMVSVFEGEINQLISQGLVEWVGGIEERLRLTHRGIFLANRVFREFV